MFLNPPKSFSVTISVLKRSARNLGGSRQTCGFCLFRRCFKGFPLRQTEEEGGDREHGGDGAAGRGKEDPREGYH